MILYNALTECQMPLRLTPMGNEHLISGNILISIPCRHASCNDIQKFLNYDTFASFLSFYRSFYVRYIDA